ncbi:MAG: hydroxymethylbilane synthase [Chloroflexota bacterium]|nr:hydroxymethylbilane synthase [Chloroflexota bacterium]
MRRPVRLGTRASALALAQAQLVAERLEGMGHATELVRVTTEGDRRQPDTAWGEGAFVAAIERALVDGRVDAAIHSAKDIPTTEDVRLAIGAYLARDDPRDALVVRRCLGAESLAELPRRARVGTDSPRRAGFLLAQRPDLQLHPLNGNVDTRLRRLDAGESDALVLAVAGLSRLGRADRIAQVLAPRLVPPAPGQGAIAVQVRSDDARTSELVGALDDRPTRFAVEVERAFLAASGGGCRSPVGALGAVAGEELTLLGGYAAPDGRFAVVDGVMGHVEDGARLVVELLLRLGERGASVDGLRQVGERRPRVLVTRAREQAGPLVLALARRGFAPVLVPTIAIAAARERSALEEAAARLDRYAWVIVTSANGAQALVSAARSVGASLAVPRWAAVGSATARVLERHGVAVTVVPSRFSAASLAGEIPIGEGERVLLARADIAPDTLPRLLRASGATVDEVVAYRTLEAPVESARLLDSALAGPPIDAVVFTSGSTVRGLASLARPDRLQALRGIPAVCIGPESAREAAGHGFLVLAQPAKQEADAQADAVAQVLSREERG